MRRFLIGCSPDPSIPVGNGQPLFTPDPADIPDSALAALPADAPLSSVVAQDDLPGSPGGPCYYYRTARNDYQLLSCIM